MSVIRVQDASQSEWEIYAVTGSETSEGSYGGEDPSSPKENVASVIVCIQPRVWQGIEREIESRLVIHRACEQ